MKQSISTLFLFLSLTVPAVAAPVELQLSNSKASLDDGPFWIQQWNLNQPSGIGLKAVTTFDSILLLTFSGSDFSYLNQQKATSITSPAAGRAEWLFSDANVEYKRTLEAQGDSLLVSVDVQFKQKTPEKAFLNLVSRSFNDDQESRDRELFYYTNGKIERLTVEKSIDPTDIQTPVKWVGAGSRYFVFTVHPESGNAEKLLIQSTGEKQAQASFQMPVVNQALHAKFKVVFAPKQMDALKAIDPTLNTTVDLGFFNMIAYPILLALKFIYKYVGNYGVAIILLTLFIKLLTFPLVVKSMKGMRKMAEFQPKMKALQEKHKDDKAALNVEMMALMKQSGYNPMAGCFPMLLQMPIFFALYRVLYAAEELYRAPFAFWITDLSAQDPYKITPVLMAGVMFLQQMLTPPSPGMDPAQRKMMMFMPLMFGLFMLTTPSGLCIYMLVNALISVLQQQYLNKKLGVPGNAANMATSF